MTNQSETIITGSDFDSHIAGNDYLIVWPESDIDSNYEYFAFLRSKELWTEGEEGDLITITSAYDEYESIHKEKKPPYPIICSGNLHKRKDGLYYLNFTNERFTGLTVYDPQSDGVLYKYYYIEGKPVLVQIYEKYTLIMRYVTRNGELAKEWGYFKYWTNARSREADEWLPYPNWMYPREKRPFTYVYEKFKNFVFKEKKPSETFYKNGVRKSKHYRWEHHFYFQEGPLKEIKRHNKEGKLTTKEVYENKPIQWESLSDEGSGPIITEYYQYDEGGNLTKTYTYEEAGEAEFENLPC